MLLCGIIPGVVLLVGMPVFQAPAAGVHRVAS